MYRMVKCLWGLRKYQEAKEFLKRKLSPTNDSAGLDKNENLIQLLDKTNALIKENATGVYDMTKFIMDSKPKTFKHGSKDVAEYWGLVEIQTIEGKDRGLVATEDIKAGQVVICCKPFAISYEVTELDEKDLGRKSLSKLIYEKIDYQHQSREELFNLFAGPELKWATPVNSEWAGCYERFEQDQRRIREIITYNSFSISLNEGYYEETSPDSSPIVRSTTTTGLWILPSYINHSCSEDNTIWKIVDDVMQVRAFKDIKKGEEILMSYLPPGLNLEERQAALSSYKFSCNCTLCYLEGKETPDTIQKRKTIVDRLQKYLETATTTDFTNLNINLILTTADELEELQTCAPKLNRSLVNTSLTTLLAELTCQNGQRLSDVLALWDKIHFICSDSGLAIMACEVAIRSLECQFGSFEEFTICSPLKKKKANQIVGGDDSNDGLLRIEKLRQDIEGRIEVLKHDLIVAYGTLDVMRIIGANAMVMLTTYGFNFFQ